MMIFDRRMIDDAIFYGLIIILQTRFSIAFSKNDSRRKENKLKLYDCLNTSMLLSSSD